MEWMLMPLKRYADFNGRSQRKEYWMFFLFQFLIQVALLIFFVVYIQSESFEFNSIEGNSGSLNLLMLPLIWLVFWIAMLIPNMAIVVRRLHDQDIPGIVGILLYIGTIIFTLPGLAILVFMCIEGKKGDNQYGPDPKMNDNVGAVFK